MEELWTVKGNKPQIQGSVNIQRCVYVVLYREKEKKKLGLCSVGFVEECDVGELWKPGLSVYDNFPLGLLALPNVFQFLLLYNVLFCELLLF